MSEGHFQSVEREIDVRAVLVAARGGNPLHHLYGVFRHLTGRAVLASPVRIRELRYDVAAFFQRIQRQRYIELTTQRRFESDLDVVVIDEHRYVEFILHPYLS